MWLSYARFEADPLPEPEADGEEGEDGGERQRSHAEAAAGPESAAARAAKARSVYERAYRSLRQVGACLLRYLRVRGVDRAFAVRIRCLAQAMARPKCAAARAAAAACFFQRQFLLLLIAL